MTARKTVDVNTCWVVVFASWLVVFSGWLISSGCLNSSAPKHMSNMIGRKERGALKRMSLVKAQIVSQEIHLNEISPVSWLILYGLSPMQYINMWMRKVKYWSAFERSFILSEEEFPFSSTGLTFMLLVEGLVKRGQACQQSKHKLTKEQHVYFLHLCYWKNISNNLIVCTYGKLYQFTWLFALTPLES